MGHQKPARALALRTEARMGEPKPARAPALRIG